MPLIVWAGVDQFSDTSQIGNFPGRAHIRYILCGKKIGIAAKQNTGTKEKFSNCQFKKKKNMEETKYKGFDTCCRCNTWVHFTDDLIAQVHVCIMGGGVGGLKELRLHHS